jgi:hypothetical protein
MIRGMHGQRGVSQKAMRTRPDSGDVAFTSQELADELAKIVAMIDLLERRSGDPARSLLGALRGDVTARRADILAQVRRSEQNPAQSGHPT